MMAQAGQAPAVENDLSVTKRSVLEIFAEGSATANRLFAGLTYERDPVHHATDLLLLRTLERTGTVTQPLSEGLGTPADQK
jgi:hypothetical protein